jgi:phenylacetate-coenzyme A ligase PaaK-like adenylate-forming protein
MFAVWVILWDVDVEQIRDLRDLEKLGNTGKAELHRVPYSKG